MIPYGKSKRRLETIIGPENTHKTGIHSILKNTTFENYGRSTQADQLNTLNSSSKGKGMDSPENMSGKNEYPRDHIPLFVSA